MILEANSIVTRSRALAAASRHAIGRSRERIECTSHLISKMHELPGFRLCSQEVEPYFRAEAIDALMEAAQQREIDREASRFRGA